MLPILILSSLMLAALTSIFDFGGSDPVVSGQDPDEEDEECDEEDGSNMPPDDFVTEMLMGTDEDENINLPVNGSFALDAGGGDDVIMDILRDEQEPPEDISDNTGPVTVDGGDGDDLISMVHLGAQDATLMGGDGDDIIRLTEAYEELGDRIVNLGEGEDIIATALYDDPDSACSPIIVEDFDPDEDQLIFELPPNGSLTSELGVLGDATMEITQEQIEGTDDTAVTLIINNLREDGESTVLQQTVLLKDSGPIPDEAIRLARIGQFVDPYASSDQLYEFVGSPGGVIDVTPDQATITGPGDDEVRVDNSERENESTYFDGTHVYTGAGDDTITAVDGTFANIHGGEGNDLITHRGVSSVIFGDSGDDTITISDRLVGAYGGTGDDVLTDNGTGNSLNGDEGNDTLTGGGASFQNGGDGDDLIRIMPDAFIDTASYNGSLSGLASGGDGEDIVEMYMGQAVNMGIYGSDSDPDTSGDDLVRVTVQEGHLDRGPALVLKYGLNDQMELTASQSVLSDISVETKFDADGIAVGYALVSGGVELVDLRPVAGSEITDPPPSLSDLNITLLDQNAAPPAETQPFLAAL